MAMLSIAILALDGYQLQHQQSEMAMSSIEISSVDGYVIACLCYQWQYQQSMAMLYNSIVLAVAMGDVILAISVDGYVINSNISSRDSSVINSNSPVLQSARPVRLTQERPKCALHHGKMSTNRCRAIRNNTGACFK